MPTSRRDDRSTEPTSAADVAALVRAVYRDATSIAAGLGRTSGIHPTDADALRLLDMAADRPTMGELGEALGLSSAAVTGVVDRLEHAGLAHRERDEHDRRRVHVVLTDRARQFGAEHLGPVSSRIRAAVAETDPDELEVVGRFLRRLVEGAAETTAH